MLFTTCPEDDVSSVLREIIWLRTSKFIKRTLTEMGNLIQIVTNIFAPYKIKIRSCELGYSFEARVVTSRYLETGV